jgi:carbon storage regulator
VLVIRRRQGESIHIGDAVEIEVIECGPNRVKLGIRAPREVPVIRNEVMLTRKQNLEAAQSILLGKLPGILEELRSVISA